jgi:Dolichyl-phosphate-mannose-protein mannosyltransferase
MAQAIRGRLVALYARLGPAARCTPRQRAWLLAIVGVAFVVRFAWVLYAARPTKGLQDPTLYLFFGGQISNGEGYVDLGGGPTAYYPVGYPATLGGLFWLLKHTPIPDDFEMAAGVLNLVLGTATVALLFDVGRRLFDNRVGLVSAAVLAVFPNLVFHTAVALTETLFNFLVMAALLVLVSASWRRHHLGWRRLAVFGALLALSALVRPISLFFLPVLFVVWVLAGWGWRPALRQVGVACIATAVVIAPWTIRNIFVMDAPVVISTNIGDNLCMSRTPDATGGFLLDAECFQGYENLERPEYETRRNNEAIRKAAEFAVEHPLDELRLMFWRAYYTIQNDHDGLDAAESYHRNPFIPDRWRDVLATLADAYFFVTLVLAVLAIRAFWRDPKRRFFLLAMASMAVQPLIFFGDVRFHVPVLPFLALGTAVTLVRLRSAPPARVSQSVATG